MRLRYAYLFSIFLSLLSCQGEEEKYVFPSVKLEFLNAQTNNSGSIISLTTDKDSVFEIETDRTGSKLEADTSRRVICYYEPIAATTGSSYAKANIWSLSKVVSPTPVTIAPGGVMKSDPVGIQSIWLSGRYINLTLQVKLQSATHAFHFIEEGVTFTYNNTPLVNLTLYHNNSGDVEAYTKTAYLSTPLNKYISKYPAGFIVRYSINTYTEGIKTYYFSYPETKSGTSSFIIPR